jgi:hypothetical protein
MSTLLIAAGVIGAVWLTLWAIAYIHDAWVGAESDWDSDER